MPHKPPVLIVDDHEDLADVLVEILQESGIDAEGFTDANKALERLASGVEPRALVVDYTFGVMRDDAFLRKARAAGVTAPAVVITGLDPRHIDDARLRETGVARVLVKPFLVDEIHEVIATLVASRGA